MSEQNILNPTSDSLLNPLYGWQRARRAAIAEIYAASGKFYGRRLGARPLEYQLTFRIPKTQAYQLEQWANQYLLDFFTLADHEAGPRYFSGRFRGVTLLRQLRNESFEFTAQFEELPGLPLFAYPTDFARDGVFLEERNGFGEDLLKLTPAADWTFNSHANHHGGAAYSNPNTDTSDTAEWLYFGYGFRLWARKNSNLGIVELSVTRTRDGASILAATNIDLYNATDLAAAALHTKTDMALDEYRVKLKATNTKNAANVSGQQLIYADAVEVMQ